MCGTSGENWVHQDELGGGSLRNLGVWGWLAGLGWVMGFSGPGEFKYTLRR
jgi:hypothetical protein